MRSRFGERPVAAAFGALVLLSGRRLDAPPRPGAPVRSPLPGFELRYPSGWRATSAPIAASRSARSGWLSPTVSPPGPTGSAYIVVFDYGRMSRPLPRAASSPGLPADPELRGVRHRLDARLPPGRPQLPGLRRLRPGRDTATRALALRTSGPQHHRTPDPQRLQDDRPRPLGAGPADPRLPVRRLRRAVTRSSSSAASTAPSAPAWPSRSTAQQPGDPRERLGDPGPQPRRAPRGTRVNARRRRSEPQLLVRLAADRPSRRPSVPGPRPFSEPETRIARNLIERIHPRITIWYHQPADLVRADGRASRCPPLRQAGRARVPSSPGSPAGAQLAEPPLPRHELVRRRAPPASSASSTRGGTPPRSCPGSDRVAGADSRRRAPLTPARVAARRRSRIARPQEGLPA